MKIKDVITLNPLCIGPDDLLTEAAAEMKAWNIGWLAVCENDRLIGILTDRDVTIRAVAEGYDPKTTSVREVMSREVFSCFDDQMIDDAAQIMEDHQVRRLPVLNRDNNLVGVITLGDLAVRAREAYLAGQVLMRVAATAQTA
jgi:CBS domain-containing protein